MPVLRRWAFAAVLSSAFAVLPIQALSVSRSYKCFFDPGSDAFNAYCERILTEYVDFWTRSRDGRWPAWPGPGFAPAHTITRIEVGGHTDNAEASRSLAEVSERRARAVAEWLIAAGIPREYVFVTGYGARELLVPTQPRQAEPQNRRVEIVSR